MLWWLRDWHSGLHHVSGQELLCFFLFILIQLPLLYLHVSKLRFLFMAKTVIMVCKHPLAVVIRTKYLPVSAHLRPDALHLGPCRSPRLRTNLQQTYAHHKWHSHRCRLLPVRHNRHRTQSHSRLEHARLHALRQVPTTSLLDSSRGPDGTRDHVRCPGSDRHERHRGGLWRIDLESS